MKIIEELKLSGLYEILFPFYKYFQYFNWVNSGKKPPAPHLYKHKLIKNLAKKFSITTFIETGTYLGTTVQTVKNNFSKIFTIEIDPKLYKRAKVKFQRNPKIILNLGNSSKILPEILKRINIPCLFWLDAHYSGGITSKGKSATPIISELQTILKHKVKTHLILIDDARDFIGKNDYPTTQELKQLITKSKSYQLRIEKDIIIIYPIKSFFH